MAPTTATALGLLVAFVLPGFVVALFQKRTFKQAEDLNPLYVLLHGLYFSVWCYVVLAGLALVFGLDRPWLDALYADRKANPAALFFYGSAAIFGSALLVWAWTLYLYQSGLADRLAGWLHINTRHQQPTAWDFWFRQRSQGSIRVLYKDGTSVWGRYGNNSFAAYSKDGGDLFLEHVFHEDNVPEDPDPNAPRGGPWFGKGKEHCLGAWVNLSDAVSVEFYNFDPDDEPKLSRSQRTKARARRGANRPAATNPETTAGDRPGEIGTARADEQAETDTSTTTSATTEEVSTR